MLTRPAEGTAPEIKTVIFPHSVHEAEIPELIPEAA
jgi:hypothetical protein